MSQEALSKFLERFLTDESFREALQNDPESAMKDYDLSPTERFALAANDEDALRRLTGDDVGGHGYYYYYPYGYGYYYVQPVYYQYVYYTYRSANVAASIHTPCNCPIGVTGCTCS
jgi:hypothetical protein